MRVLRFLRSETDITAPGPDVASDGLDAFSSEGDPNESATPQTRTPTAVLWLLGFLTIAVLLEAVPTALWLRSALRPPDAVASAPAPAAVPPAMVAAAPCEPTAAAPSPEPPAPSAPVAASAAAAGAAVAPVAPRALAGMLSVSAPVAMRVFEQSRLIGTTEAETIMLSVGTHTLDFVNESVGYRERRTVTVQAGRTANLQLEPPHGTLHINAVPWAEVFVDNERVGETPIGNLKMPIGNHQVVFRHPELGERRATVLVTLVGPARISMDLRAK